MTDKHQSEKVIVVSGPSGVGKSTIVWRIVNEMDEVYLSVSATTRARSESEVNGRDYWFVSREEFERGIENGRFLEYAEVYGNLYGTPKDKVDEQLSAGRSVILEIDVQGGMQVKQRNPDAVMIFIVPPGRQELVKRLCSRGRDEQRVARIRLEGAEKEIKTAEKWYENMVVNDDLEKAVSQVKRIIQRSIGDKYDRET